MSLRERLKKDGIPSRLSKLEQQPTAHEAELVNPKGRGGSATTAELPDTAGSLQNLHYPDGHFIEVPIDIIRPNPDQPRTTVNNDAIRQLAEDIRQRGLLQPLIIKSPREEEEVVWLRAGHRRYAAAKLAGLKTVPAMVNNSGDDLEVALVENLLREDLSPFEEADSFKKLIERKGMTQEHLGKMFNKTKASISQTLSLLRLPKQVRDAWDVERISKRLLIALAAETKDRPEEEIVALFQAAKTQGMNVEELRDVLPRRRKKKGRALSKSSELVKFERFRKYVEEKVTTKDLKPEEIDQTITAVEGVIDSLSRKKEELIVYRETCAPKKS